MAEASEGGRHGRPRLPGHRDHRFLADQHRGCDPDRGHPRLEDSEEPALVRSHPDARPDRGRQGELLPGRAEARLHDRGPVLVMPKAYLAGRAEVSEADRARFDEWYATVPLPWALPHSKTRCP